MSYRALLPALAIVAGMTVGFGGSAQDAAPPRAEPFTVAVPDAVLADLRDRLARTRWPDQLPGTGWDYGTDTAYLKELVAYWQSTFDWRAQERRLNGFHHYRAAIDGTRIHFIHERSRDPNATPLLILHGWPSSFVQMLDIIPLLTDPAAHGMPGAPSFHVVVASLPGFGFSDPPARKGVGFATSAELMAKLMTDVLGYSRYGVRGSDLGGVIVRQMAATHPDSVIGVHLTGIIGTAGGQAPFTAAEQAFIDATAAMETDIAYARLQMSRPQTLAVSLMDSPAGLASWIIEKFRSWSDSGGNVESRFSKDELLTNLMRLLGQRHRAVIRAHLLRVHSRAAETRAPRDAGRHADDPSRTCSLPRRANGASACSTCTHWVETDRGGHFLEWEEPELVARDLQAFFSSLR